MSGSVSGIPTLLLEGARSVDEALLNLDDGLGVPGGHRDEVLAEGTVHERLLLVLVEDDLLQLPRQLQKAHPPRSNFLVSTRNPDFPRETLKTKAMRCIAYPVLMYATSYLPWNPRSSVDTGTTTKSLYN